MRAAFLALAAAGASVATFGASNIDPAQSQSYSGWLGRFEWRPSAEHGAAINQFFCGGFVYGAQVGWIHLGSGAPADGVRYRNNSAGDFGVNVLPGGALRGLAYGANIGWINFEEQGNPRVDWSTGKLSGAAYSANGGWLPLEGPWGEIRIDRIADLPDSDGDGLPDAWEIAHAGTLTLLSGAADSDGDGVSDRDEYLAGTNPLDKNDRLGPLVLQFDPISKLPSVRWPSEAGYLYQLERRVSLQAGSSWMPVNSAPLVGTGGTIAYTLPQNAGPGFFRVRAFPPLSRIN